MKYNHKVTILTKSNKNNLPFNCSKKINFLYLNKKISIKKEAEILLEFFKKKKADHLILDIEHKMTTKVIYEIFLKKIELILDKIICWDNIITRKYIFGLTYRPYPNFINLLKLNSKQRSVNGLHNMYFPKFKKKIQNSQTKKIKNILIFLSGSKEKNKLKKIIHLLDSYKSKVRYNFILSHEYKINFPKNLQVNHNFIFRKTKDTNQFYNNIDLAIIGGGMTKYECMINLIPTMIINLDLKQIKINSRINNLKFGIVINNLNNLLKKFNEIVHDKVLINKIIKNYTDIRKKYNEKKLLSRLLNS